MTSMGMTKSGTHELNVANTWIKVTGWIVRTGFPGTSIVNNALVMDVMATGNLTWRGQFNGSTGTQQFRVVRNGSVVVGPAVNNQVVGNATGVSVNAGDTLELQAFTSSTVFDIVQDGASTTYLEFNQTSQNYNIAASQSVAWGITSTASLGAELDADDTVINWHIESEMSQGANLDSDDTVINWDIEADLYQGIHYDIEAERNINWNIDASMLLIPKTVVPPSVFTFADISVSVHTIDGVVVGDFPCRLITAYNWGRESTEVSTCSIDVATQGDPDLVEELRQWVHWITVWHDDTPAWTGPIQTVRITRSTTTISARDPSTFMWRTRVPITRTFTDTSPARIADGLWQAMNQHHGIRATPVVLPGIAENTFTVAAVADSRMLHQLMDELVKVGLQWTVIGGRVVLGEFTREPVAELYECDFMVELERRRDGTQTFNDVRVQGQNWAQTVVVDLAGLKLQTLVSIDDMFGAGNIQRAALQYARDSATLRDELVVPSNASLHPQAPVTLNDLVPGKTFAVYYENISQLMRLDQVTFSGSPESFDVQVTLVALTVPGQTSELTGG